MHRCVAVGLLLGRLSVAQFILLMTPGIHRILSWHLFLFDFNARAPVSCHFHGGNVVSRFTGKSNMYFYKTVIDEHQNMFFAFRFFFF